MKVILLLQTHLCAYQNIEDIHDIRILKNKQSPLVWLGAQSSEMRLPLRCVDTECSHFLP